MWKIRKPILLIMACATAIVCVNVKNYQATRTEIRNEINESFCQLAPSWADSIYRKTNKYIRGSFNTNIIKREMSNGSFG